MRRTLPRRLVWETLTRIGPHCTAEQIATALQAQHITIPKSTIYRALDALVSSGLVRVMYFGGEPARYECGRDAHQHAVCKVCHTIIHLEDQWLDTLRSRLEHDYRFTPLRTDVVIVGICTSCASQ